MEQNEAADVDHAFRTWLQAQNLTVPGFVETIREKTGVRLSEGTVHAWVQQVHKCPRNTLAQIVLSVFPDCPLQ